MKTIKLSLWSMTILALVGFSACKKAPYNSTIESNVYTLSNWTEVSNDAWNFEFETSVSIPSITQDVIDNGAVMCYVKDSNSNIALPYTMSVNQDASLGGHYFSATFGYKVFSGKVIFNFSGFDDLDVHTASEMNQSGYEVKVVVLSEEKLLQHPEVDLNNYSDVRKAFQIKD